MGLVRPGKTEGLSHLAPQLFGVRRLDAALVRGSLTPLPRPEIKYQPDRARCDDWAVRRVLSRRQAAGY